MVGLELELVESDKEIEKKIIKAFRQEITTRISRAARKLKPSMRSILERVIKSQPEYAALDGGRLAGDFGLIDGKASADAIIRVWLDSLKIRVLPTRQVASTLRAGLTIEAIKADYSDVTVLPDAIVVTNKGQELPWLEWLLLLGNSSIIMEYDVFYNARNQTRSRSGQAIMARRRGRSWSVPNEFSGVQDNNWITRAIDSGDDEIEKTIISTVQGEF